MGEFAIGQPVPREEDPRLLSGCGQFLDDVNLRNQAWGYVLRSPHAMAKIVSIDTSKAETRCRNTKNIILLLTDEECA